LSSGNELWDNNAGKNWQVVVELAHREGLILQAHTGAALRSLVSSLLLRLDALAALGLLTPEQFGVLRNKAWAQDFGLIRTYESVRRGWWGVGWGVGGDRGWGSLLLGLGARTVGRVTLADVTCPVLRTKIHCLIKRTQRQQVRFVADDHAVASLLLSRFNFLRRPGLHVVHVASEMVPVAKVGGLGDVVAGLAKAHQQR
jgi:hypothetical protein